MPISKLRIFPPIGIARVGNGAGFFLGPEIPGLVSVTPEGFRDATTKRLKRQGARFRLYSYDETDQLLGEITAADAQITWKVHLANTKASAEWFTRKVEPPNPDRPALRNASVTPRDHLNLDAGIQSVSGANPAFPDLDASKAAGRAIDVVVNQTLFGQPISAQIGTILTDDAGRLVVLGGLGDATSPSGRSLETDPKDFANHDEWYDDVADGPISAEVTFPDGSAPLTAISAWVITAPPKFAPAIHHPVTLYDSLLQAMVDRGLTADLTQAPGYQPLYSRDILPILRRAFDMRWVYSRGRPDLAHHSFHNVLDTLPNTDDGTVFEKLGVPSATAGEPATGGGDMPKMWSDRYDQAFVNGTLTRIQYANMKLWSAGTFTDDSGNPPSPPIAVDPDGLTRAALESCIGAPFYPGIEASWKLRDVYPFVEPFRLDAAIVKPGDVTKQMSLPWQSDFLDCSIENGRGPVLLVWWPAQRPINVLLNNKYVEWDRPFADATTIDMVAEWWKLGFVLEQGDGTFAEVDRV